MTPRPVAPLLWTGPNGVTFEWRIVGYQFPHIVEDYDANWLVVEFTAANGAGSWTSTDPCLLTWDLRSLRRWLGPAGDRRARGWSTMERALELAPLGRSSRRVHVAVRLGGGLGPDAPDAAGPQVLAVAFTRAELVQTRAVLSAWSAAFPPRGAIGASRRLRKDRTLRPIVVRDRSRAPDHER